MELVDLIRPTFMTLEEVTTFLLTSLRLDHTEKGGSTRQVQDSSTAPFVGVLLHVTTLLEVFPGKLPEEVRGVLDVSERYD